MQDDSYKYINLNINSTMITELVEQYRRDFDAFEKN